MNATLAAQAAQSAQQGQQMLQEDRAKSSAAEGQYNSFNDQATQANKQLQAQSAYMQGEGSATNLYESERNRLQNESGYNPAQLADANKSLFSMTGALNSATSQFNTPGGVGAYGMSAPALAGYQGSILQPLQTGVANANTEVGTLNDELKTFLTGASQYATVGVQGEQATVDALNKAVVNFKAQADSSLQNMQFYSQLASTQGGLNATQTANYAQAQQSYAQAQQAIAQAGLIASQTTGQNLANTQTQNVMNAAKPAAPIPNHRPSNTMATGGNNSSSNAAKIAATNGVSNLDAVKASNPSVLQQLVGTSGANIVHKIGSFF